MRNEFTALMSLLFFSCAQERSSDFLGSAVVETRTYQVATTSQGRIQALFKQEGLPVDSGELIGVIDTTIYHLQRLELLAAQKELNRTLDSKRAEIKGAQAELRGLERDHRRVSGLVAGGSLPEQQGDKLATSLSSARFKVKSAQDMLAALQGKSEGLDARLGQIEEQIRRCYLMAPATGRVLTRFKNPDEILGPGQPVYEVGREDTVFADMYVPQTVLGSLQYGRQVRLRVDMPGDEPAFVPGFVSWIGNEAEFSPKNIQTRESRNELMFKVRVVAGNKNGMLKRGLPVEIWK